MSVYHHDQEESPWAILDPSLKQHYFPKDSSSYEPSYLEYPFTLIEPPSPKEEAKPEKYQERSPERESERKQEKQPENISEKKKENPPESLLQQCTKETNEIEAELLHHRHSIYSEKLKLLQNELKSIENETHKTIIKHDKKFAKTRDKELSRLEALFEYQLEMVEKQVQDEKQQISEDINQKAEFARRVLISECGPSNSSAKKRKEISGSHSETDETESEIDSNFNFKKIHLKLKIGKLQAISDRQRSSKKNFDDALYHHNHEELEQDLLKMKKHIGD